MTAWFEGIDPADAEAAATRIAEGSAEEPADWPAEAVTAGVVPDRGTYYEYLRAATLTATTRAVETRERADDRQLIHSVRAMDDVSRVANELAERVHEWAGSRGLAADDPVETARQLDADPEASSDEHRVRSLAARVRDLLDEKGALQRHVEQTAPGVAPNLAALAGPVLAARLIALAGDLESLAKKPAGTVQVLGAEDALFAHLRGQAPSPKHGIIYTHEYVRNTAREHRGSAARALAGKLAIAARIDHYSGDRRPELQRELDDRIATIRARTASGDGDSESTAGGEEEGDDG